MSDPTAAKAAMRAAHTARRKQLRQDPERKAALDAAIVANTAACLAHFGALGTPVAAYSPLPSEPGPADFPARIAAHAHPVWLPISLPGGVLAWARHDSGSAPGALGIAEPTGPREDSGVLISCGLVVVPALGVDKQKMRLGKGAGYYDRALAGLAVPVAAVVFDHEVVDAVPHEPHDQPVDAVITPAGFWVL